MSLIVATENLVWNPYDRRFACKLTFFYKIVKGNSPQYLSDYLQRSNKSVYNTRNANQIMLNTFKRRTKNLKTHFVVFCISWWSKLSNFTKAVQNIKKFENILMKNIKSIERSSFSIREPQDVKLLSQLRLNLNQHKFRHNFKECVSPIPGCGLETESTRHFFILLASQFLTFWKIRTP